MFCLDLKWNILFKWLLPYQLQCKYGSAYNHHSTGLIWRVGNFIIICQQDGVSLKAFDLFCLWAKSFRYRMFLECTPLFNGIWYTRTLKYFFACLAAILMTSGCNCSTNVATTEGKSQIRNWSRKKGSYHICNVRCKEPDADQDQAES